MGNIINDMDRLEASFITWARARPDIDGAFVVGSRARTDHPADEWSDLDIGFVTSDIGRYLSDDEWVADIAEPWITYVDPVGPTRHVLFAGGLDAGFTPLPEKKVRLATRVVPVLNRFSMLYRLVPGGRRLKQQIAEAQDYYRRGARIILDKHGMARAFLSALPAEALVHPRTTQQQFADVVNEFWFKSVWTAKHLCRGELWYAKTTGFDGRMKTLLLRMLEWRAKAAHGWDYDTWEDGRFLEEWVDAHTLRELRETFGHYNAQDVARALMATMDTFRRLARETADALHIDYPTGVDERATQCVTICLDRVGVL